MQSHAHAYVASVNQTPRADQGFFPIRRLKAVRADALPVAGTVYKLAVAGIKACMQAALPLSVLEDQDIRSLQPLLGGDQPARARLVACYSGYCNALLLVGPLNEARTIKALAGRGAAAPVARADLRIGALQDLVRRRRRF